MSTRSAALDNATSWEAASAGVFFQRNVFNATLMIIVTLMESGVTTNSDVVFRLVVSLVVPGCRRGSQSRSAVPYCFQATSPGALSGGSDVRKR